MSDKLTEDQNYELAISLQWLGQTLGDYWNDNASEFSDSQREELRQIEMYLYGLATELNMESMTLSAEAMKEDIESLAEVTEALQEVEDKIQDIGHSVLIAAKAVDFINAIISRDLKDIAKSGQKLVKEFDPDFKDNLKDKFKEITT